MNEEWLFDQFFCPKGIDRAILNGTTLILRSLYRNIRQPKSVYFSITKHYDAICIYNLKVWFQRYFIAFKVSFSCITIFVFTLCDKQQFSRA